ncbi:MAG: hypothetical protein R2731_18060 [Nocardioides sp.]
MAAVWDTPGVMVARGVVGVGLLAVVLAAAPAGAAGEDLVRLDFEEASAGEPIVEVANTAGTATTQEVLTAGGGSLSAGQVKLLDAIAARFPAYDGAAHGARAVIAVTNTGSADVLEPGAAAFRVGATVRLRTKSEGTAYDNGNNVIQRGRGGDPTQIKLQVDHRRPMCRVAGADGALSVTSSVRMATRVWYRLRCDRVVLEDGDRLRLRVTEVRHDGTTSTLTRSRVGPIGAVTFPLATALSVGAS